MNNVNVGLQYNDGLGDKLRDAFIIVNENFSEIQDTIDNLSLTASITDISGLQTVLDNLQNEIDTLQISDISGLTASLSSITNNITSLQTSISNLESADITLQDNINGLNTSIDTINTSIIAINNTIIDIISILDGITTPTLQSVTDAGAVTTNEIVFGSQSGLYSLINDRSLLIDYSSGITESNTNRGYFSVFNEWDGENWFEAYYTTYSGSTFKYYDIYAYDAQINLDTYDSEVNKFRGFDVSKSGFRFTGNSATVTLNIDDLTPSTNYTLKLPNKPSGTYTIATTADLSGGDTRPYKSYVALLNQSGANAPVATIMENTIGTITFAYQFPGQYKIYSSNLFTAAKTTVSVSESGAGFGEPSAGVYINSTGEMTLTSANSATQANGILSGTVLEIRVYN